MKKLFKSLKLSLVSISVVIAITACGGGGAPDTNTTVDDTITHNGVSYKTVTSPTTGKVWLDRNLGAAQVCTAYNDVACYGDYYQWGRNADGHEDSTSAITDEQATNVDNVGHSLFIVSDNTKDYDWAYSSDTNGDRRVENWSKADGSSICPIGFRVPTFIELSDEFTNINNRDEVYSSFLKLPSAGHRTGYNSADLAGVGTIAYIWSSTAITVRARYRARYFKFTSSRKEFLSATGRSNGSSIRCIKN